MTNPESPSTNTVKKIIFLTGTRADFGKLKSLIEILRTSPVYDVHIFVTGMHMLHRYGYTVKEIEKCGYSNIYTFINHTSESSMDLTLAKTIEGFSAYVSEINPDLIVVHGDRVETLAGAIVGALNNVLVAHIEGGEVSGTVDELIRHSVSKMSHIHFVANDLAKKRLRQMGEVEDSIHVIGSPDVDLMFSKNLPSISEVKTYYEIPFDNYSIVMFHPVTTEYAEMKGAATHLVDALLADEKNYVVIFPNNDLGSKFIIEQYERLEKDPRFRIFPSIRFEYFLVLLKYSQFMIGNSSAGLREAPYYGIPSINIGSRQNNRSVNPEIINCGYAVAEVQQGIQQAMTRGRYEAAILFGAGGSDQSFLTILSAPSFWTAKRQKLFTDLDLLPGEVST